MDQDAAALLVELIEKMGLLRRDMQQKKELDRYAARFQRIEQKLNALADRLSQDDPELAKALRLIAQEMKAPSAEPGEGGVVRRAFWRTG